MAKDTSKAPFQITREGPDFNGRYLFELVDTRTGDKLGNGSSRSPIAPQELRTMQARLNSRTTLDYLGV